MPETESGNPIAEKRRQRKLENQRLEAAARQRQADLQLQKERDLKRQEDERIATEQRRLDELDRLRRQREAEQERIATIERTEKNRVLAVERQLKLLGAFCTQEIPLATQSLPQCCAVLSPSSLEKPIPDVDAPLALIADAACCVSVYCLRDRHCLSQFRIEYETASAAGSACVTSMCTTRSGHLIVCNQKLGVLGAYDINQLVALAHSASLSIHHAAIPCISAASALVGTYAFPTSGASRIRAVCIDDTANELFATDDLRHCVHVLALHPSAFQRETTASKSKPFVASSRCFGSKGHGRGQLLGPAGLDVSHYHVVVCDRGNHRIAVFTKRGVFVCAFGAKGCAPGAFTDPRDVALANVRKRVLSRGFSSDDSGISNEQFEVIVADLGNFRVQVLNEAGACLRVLSLLSGSDQIEFHQHFLSARYAKLLELCASTDTPVPTLAGSDLRDLFRLAERLHPSCPTYQAITENVRAFRDDAAHFDHPLSVAYVAKDREIVVLDRQNSALVVYNIDGSNSVWSPLPTAKLTSVDSALILDDCMVVSDPQAHRIAVLAYPSLSFLQYIGATTYGDQVQCSEGFEPGELRSPTFLSTFHDHGERQLLVADSGNHCVAAFDLATGAFRARIGNGFGHLEGYFDSPQGIAVYENQWLFVCDQRNHRVQVFDLETKSFVRSVGRAQGSAPGAFSFPLSVAVCGALSRVDKCDFGAFRDAKFCIGDAGNRRVQVFNMADDSVLYCLDARDTPFGMPIEPACVAFHPTSSYVLVADAANRSVAVFRHDGTFVAAFGSNLEPENRFQRPTTVQLLNDRVVVTDAVRVAICTFALRS